MSPPCTHLSPPSSLPLSIHPSIPQFALSPSDFSCSDIPEGELGGKASRGVKIVYMFPWGPEPLETLWSRGDAELLQAHEGVRTKLQVSVSVGFRGAVVASGFVEI